MGSKQPPAVFPDIKHPVMLSHHSHNRYRLWAALLMTGVLAHGPALASADHDPAPTTEATASAPSPTALTQLANKGFPSLNPEAPDITAWQGRPVVINFWATWCAPCIKEMPALAALAHETGNRATFVGIAADTPANVRRFATQNPTIDFPLLLAGYNALHLARDWGNTRNGLPFTVVLNAHGQIQWRHSGTLDIDMLRSMLKSGEMH